MSTANYREPMTTAQHSDPVPDRWRAMLRMAIRLRQPKPSSPGASAAYAAGMALMLVVPGALYYIVGVSITVFLIAAGLSWLVCGIGWAAWVFYGRSRHS